MTEYSITSRIIRDAIQDELIKEGDPNKSRKYTSYPLLGLKSYVTIMIDKGSEIAKPLKIISFLHDGHVIKAQKVYLTVVD